MALDIINSLIISTWGLSLQQLLLLYTFGLTFILSAIDLRIASIIGLVLLVAQLAYFYSQGYDVTLNVLSILVMLIIMSLSIFLVRKKELPLP